MKNMPTFKITDWLDDEAYLLLGIHTSVAPYRLAYLINTHLKMMFARTAHDQDVRSEEYVAQYPVYKHEDPSTQVIYYLVANNYLGKPIKTQSSGGLFQDLSVQEINVTLIKEYKEVDFLLKICTEDASYNVQQLLASLTKVPDIISAYQLDRYHIKHQDYLIFE